MERDRASAGAPERPRSVLLLEDGPSDAGDRLCGELLAGEHPGETRLLLVTLVDTPATRLAAWDAVVDERPAEVVAVRMAVAGGDTTGEPEIDVHTISNPSNLTRFGVQITEALAALDGDHPAVCFHSLSVLLQYVTVEQAFQFLSVLKSHLDTAEATAHFHLDPSTHDEQTVATLCHLFDEVVRASEG
ncbi:MAG: hypothetical protein ABEH78_06625 [Haloferacaceae archaeon]